MEPSAAWCPTCYSEITLGALRCRYCGTYFQGRHTRDPITIPPLLVDYGPTGPTMDETGQFYAAGVALNFHAPSDEGAHDRTD